MQNFGKRQVRSIDEMPLLRGMSKVFMPDPPRLDAGEEVLFDFSAQRLAAPLKWRQVLLPWMRYSFGRLTVTNRRIIYATLRRNWTFLFLTTIPADLQSVEFPLTQTGAVARLSWWKRVNLGSSPLPWYTAVEVRLVGGQYYRFGSLLAKAWRRTAGELAATHPQFA